MNKTENNKLNIIEKIKNGNVPKHLIIIIAIVLIVIMLFINSSPNKSEGASKDVNSYINNLDNRLSSALSEVEGAGNVKVVITLQSGTETVLAVKKVVTNDNGKTETEESPILVNGKTVVVKELYPKISGVLIVAEGANNITVKTRLLSATQSLLDVNINKIEILTKK